MNNAMMNESDGGAMKRSVDSLSRRVVQLMQSVGEWNKDCLRPD
jgi:hypothetical protein